MCSLQWEFFGSFRLEIPGSDETLKLQTDVVLLFACQSPTSTVSTNNVLTDTIAHTSSLMSVGRIRPVIPDTLLPEEKLNNQGVKLKENFKGITIW